MILICYDGSADARAAVDHGARLLAGKRATVLAVWEPFVDIAATTGVGIAYLPPTYDVGEIDTASRQRASEFADEGTARARDLGLEAQSQIAAREGTVASTILSVANQIDAEAIVMGSRGLTGIKSLLLGSVSHTVLHDADRPVLVVPSDEVVTARARTRQHS